jgi:thiol-disulfide isomerase/thioredoxin
MTGQSLTRARICGRTRASGTLAERLPCKARGERTDYRVAPRTVAKEMFVPYRLAAALALAVSASLPGVAQTDPAPTLTGKTMKPETVELAKLRGQVVMLFFWSTDCPVCLDKLPELRRNLEGWRGKDFQIIAVSQDRSMADLKAYEQVLDKVAPPNPQMKIVWRKDPQHRDSFGDLPLRAPTTVVLDRTGKVTKTIRGRVPAEIWDDVAELVLN